jgi:thermolabile hemolysin
VLSGADHQRQPKTQTKSDPMKRHNRNSPLRNSTWALALSLVLTSISAMAAPPFSKIVTFGDSLSDTGYAYQLTGGLFPPSPPNAVGRLSNGPLWVEHLATTLGVNLHVEDQYAVAGARTDTGNFNTYFGLATLANTGLASQVATYLQASGPAGADPAALHTVWIGSNDVFTTLTFGGDMNSTVVQAVQNTVQAVVTLASHGARHILVVNLPDLGLTPFGLSLGQSFSAQLSYLTDAYNAGLQQALNALDAAGIRTIRLDAADLIRDIVADPAAFGLVNVTTEASTSGDDPQSYLFWDQVHPTAAGHQAVAARAVEELVAYYSPRRGGGQGPGLVRSLNGLVRAAGR